MCRVRTQGTRHRQGQREKIGRPRRAAKPLEKQNTLPAAPCPTLAEDKRWARYRRKKFTILYRSSSLSIPRAWGENKMAAQMPPQIGHELGVLKDPQLL